MVKPTNSQQVESQMANRILQQVESDTTSPSLGRSVSFQVIPSMTQGDEQAAEQDADNDEDQGHAISNVQESIAVGITRRNPHKPSWLATNMIVAYAIPVVEEEILSIYGKAEINSESKMWKDAMMEEMSSLYINDTWELSELPKRKKAMSCKWVFAKKQESLDGDIVRYKVRLVAKSYVQ